MCGVHDNIIIVILPHGSDGKGHRKGENVLVAERMNARMKSHRVQPIYLRYTTITRENVSI